MCYVYDICVHSASPMDLEQLLDSVSLASSTVALLFSQKLVAYSSAAILKQCWFSQYHYFRASLFCCKWPLRFPTMDATNDWGELHKNVQILRVDNSTAAISSVIHNNSDIVYIYGSLQLDGAAGNTAFSFDLEPTTGGWVGHRHCGHSSSTLCELYDTFSMLLA